MNLKAAVLWIFMYPVKILLAQELTEATPLPNWIADVFNDVAVCGRETPELKSFLQAVSEGAPAQPGPEAYEKLTRVMIKQANDFGIPDAGDCHETWGIVNSERFLKGAKDQGISLELLRELVQSIMQKHKDPWYVANWNYTLASLFGFGRPETAELEESALAAYERAHETKIGEAENANYQYLLKVKNRQPKPRVIFFRVVFWGPIDQNFEYSSLSTSFTPEEVKHITLLLEFASQDLDRYGLKGNEDADKRRRLETIRTLMTAPDFAAWLGSDLGSILEQFLQEQFVASRERKEERGEAMLKIIQTRFELVIRWD